MNPDTREERLLLVDEQASRYSYIYWNLGWSHDSRSIAFKAQNRQTGEDELAVADIDSPRGFKVLHSKAASIRPDFTWSPDNRRVLFAMSSPLHRGPMLFSLDRTEPDLPKLLPGQPLDRSMLGCAYSPDGRHIAFCSERHPQPIDWPAAEGAIK